jgi:Flp pilus assembly protein TadD
MKRVAVWLLFFGVALGVRAQSPDAEFLQFYSIMQQGEVLERSGQHADAMDRFQTAQRDLQRFAKAYPNWNEKLVKFRLSYLAGKIGSLGMKKVEPAPTKATPTGVVPLTSTAPAQPVGWTPADRERLERAERQLAEAEARAQQAFQSADEANARANQADERTAQLALDLRLARDRVEVLQATEQNLTTARTRLESERNSLQARLREALAPKPAALDPAELARSQERNLLLTKENEILKASLDRQMADYKKLVETAAKALELEKQLGAARTELASLRRENNDLRGERQKLTAKVEALGKKSDTSAALRGEIEELKRELAQARGSSDAGISDSDLAKLRAELAEQRAAAAELRADNNTLVRELDKLTAIKVTPASLKTAEVPSLEFAATEALNRVRRLERERDELRQTLEQTRNELKQRESAGQLQGTEMTAKVSGLEARIASLEAKPEPYAPEELALFQAPSRSAEIASATPVAASRAPVQMAQATPAPGAPAPASTPAATPQETPASAATNAPSAPSAAPAASPSSSGSATPPPAGGARRRTLRDLPSGASILAAQAQRAFAQRRFEDAEKAYREILTLDERNVFTLGNLAAILVERGRLDESEVMLKRALEADPQDPFSLSLQGIIRFRQQRYDEAFDALSRSAVLDPDNADTQNYLGITLSQRGQRKAAEAALRKALKLAPSSPAAHYNLAVVYATQKPPYLELARYHYDKARRSGQPANPAFEGVLRGESPTPVPPSAPTP